MDSENMKMNLLSWKGKMRTLHLSWIAFFISFYVWFNHAPLMAVIKGNFGLSDAEVKTLLILNVALTIPARIIIGVLVDKYGPRLIYSLLLAVASIPCFFFAFAQSFEQLALARFLLGGVGAGFVIGIRLVGEWFPAKQVGLAEGIYGGWGNFGSAAAAFSLPTLALLFGGDDGWRYAIALTGFLSLIFSFVFYRSVRNTPKGSTYFKPKKSGALEVTSRGDFIFLILMQAPLYGCLALLTSKLIAVGLITATSANGLYLALTALFAVNVYKMYGVNRENLIKPVPELYRYKFRQVAILDLAYLVTFGSELAVVSMLPLYFLETFDSLTPVTAGLLASGFAFMNLVARPGGGWISDRFGRRQTLTILLLGVAAGYYAMSGINASWPLPVAVIATMACSFFVQAGEGAVFAMVPLVQRRLTGQVAGMVGAYGNVGAVLFLTVLAMIDAHTFFMVIACAALVTVGAVRFLEEPEGRQAEVGPDGRVQMIDVS